VVGVVWVIIVDAAKTVANIHDIVVVFVFIVKGFG